VTIRYDLPDVALMLKVALYFQPSFLSGTRLSRAQQRLIAYGRMKPTAAVLRKLNLDRDGEGFVWTVR
jgi:hypothetical protein